MICPRCKTPMKEVSKHLNHKMKKFRCPECGFTRMKKLKPRKKKFAR